MTEDLLTWEALLETLKQWYFVIASDRHDEPGTWVPNGPRAIEAREYSYLTSAVGEVSRKEERREAMEVEIAEKTAARRMGHDIRWGLAAEIDEDSG